MVSPANGATMDSSFPVNASSRPSASGATILGMILWLDGVEYGPVIKSNTLTVPVNATPGAHTFSVSSWDNSGRTGSSPVYSVSIAQSPAPSSPAATTPQETLRSQNVTVSYTASTANFPNPERGFALDIDPPWPTTPLTWHFCDATENPSDYTWTATTAPLSLPSLASYRAQGISVVMVRYHIAAWRYQPLAQSFLDQLTADFATAREAGFKVDMRFVYNWPEGGPDAPLSNVLTHISQLAPVLQANADVIAFMDLGFVGCWGEEHASSFGLVGADLTNPAFNRIVEAVFQALPSSRMVAVRYPAYKFQYFGGLPTSTNPVPLAPLTAAQAFSGSIQARWGEHDDCPTCGEFNWGTWNTSGGGETNGPAVRKFLSQDNQFVVQAGEPGDPNSFVDPVTGDPDQDGYTADYGSCARTLWQFQAMHWSVISATYGGNPNNAAYLEWRNQGCYDTIAQKLGYRFRLTQSSIPSTVAAGQPLNLSFTVMNDGYASPYNERLLEVILRNNSTGAVYRIRENTNPGMDPRFWLSGSNNGSGYAINVTDTVPTNVPAGTYSVLLSLPDPMPSLYENPAYSIQLANVNMWEATTGYNNLGQTITITSPNP